jgi:hypothetical protein
MDPTANLKEIRETVAAIMRYDDSADPDVIRLCELVESLDDWLARGGFLPKQWQTKE